ncbi:MAG: hypothetical protein H0U67_07855 [Gemmatimonadetes bacterium]|nr:hypothetical protein [Gemmatimonadota bacterium]
MRPEQERSSDRMYAVIIVVGVAMALAGAGRPAEAQEAPQAGCYRADRPLGASRSGPLAGADNPEAGALSRFRLLEDGQVDRPGTSGREWWAGRSRWEARGDDLHVRLSTGTSGWDLRLVRAEHAGGAEYVGEATYLTDVVVRDTAGSGGWQRLKVEVRVSRESCASPA